MQGVGEGGVAFRGRGGDQGTATVESTCPSSWPYLMGSTGEPLDRDTRAACVYGQVCARVCVCVGECVYELWLSQLAGHIFNGLK